MPKILLIEDDATMLNLLGTLLQMEGFQVAKVSKEETVEDFLETMRREKPDVALLDVHLHNVSGYDLLRQLRKDRDLRHIRVVMSSGMDVRTECLLAGANDFILKPYMPDDLIRLIRKTIEAR